MKNLYQLRKRILIISFAVVVIALCITMCVLYLKTTNASQNNAGTSTLVKKASLQSDIYKIEEGYISRILPETTLRDLKNNLDKEDITVTKKDGNLLKETEFIGTGMKLTYGQKEYKLAVVDDLNGDGKAGITDLTQMKLISVGLRAKPVNEYAKAADINGDGKVSITDLTKSNLASVNLIDIIAPTSFTPEVVSTKDTITVQGETSDSNSGIKEYWFEINNNGWVQNTDKLNTKYTFAGLTTETKYTIRMKTVDKAGNVKITKRIEKETLNEENANISIVASTEEWTNQNILVAINFNSNVAKEKKQMSLDGGRNWTDYVEPITVEKNMKIKARVVNSKGDVLEEQEKTITNIDKLKPNEFVATITPATNTKSITVAVNVEDATTTKDNGKSGIKEYEYTIINEMWQSVYKSTNTTYTFTDLEIGKQYIIKVKAIDNAGNERNSKNSDGSETDGDSVILGTIDDLINNLGGITIKPSTTEWTNQNVTVEVIYPLVTGLQREISLDGGASWKIYISSETIEENTIIKARMKNSKNQTSKEETLTIGNIDKQQPKDFEINTTYKKAFIIEESTPAMGVPEGDNINTKKDHSTVTISASVNAEDLGNSGIAGYSFRIDGGNWSEFSTSGQYTSSALAIASQYLVEVRVIDNAGNIREKGKQVILNENIDDMISEDDIEIRTNTDKWTNQNITVKLKYIEMVGFNPEISLDEGETWNTYTTPISVSKNLKVQARLREVKTNKVSRIVEKEITNIDKLKPTVEPATVTSTINSITVIPQGIDAEATEDNGKSGIKEYEIGLKKSPDGETTVITSVGEYAFNNLNKGTYTIGVKAIDNAGNKSWLGYDTNITLKTIDDLIEETGEGIRIIPSTTEWTNQNITVTVEYPNIQGLVGEISLDNGVVWKNYTGVETIQGNTIVKARMKDKTNQVSTPKVLEITNIDKLSPKDFEMEAIASTNSISVNVNTEDAEATNTSGTSGIKGYQFKINDNAWTDIQKSGAYTFINLTQGTNYTIRVRAIDNAGNITNANQNGSIDGKTIPTPRVDDEIEKTGQIQIKQNITEFTNTDVVIEVIYPEINELRKEVKVGNEEWRTYTETFKVSKNTTIQARLIDSSGQASTPVEKEINNIDKLLPKDFEISATATTNSITINIGTASNPGTTDAEKTQEYASSGIKEYKYTIINGFWKWTETSTSVTNTFRNLMQGKKYKIIVSAIDNAGNETINNTLNSDTTAIQTNTAGEIIITADKTEWTKDNVKVTVTYPDNTDELSKNISIDNGATWQEYTDKVVELTIPESTTVKAKIMDGENQVGRTAEYRVVNIDKLPPEDFTINETVTATTIEINGATTDSLSGIEGYYFSKDNGATWVQNSYKLTNKYKFEGLTPATTYNMQIKVIDKVGNERIVTKAVTTDAKYTLTINANGGTYSGSTTISQAEGTRVTISNPTRENYTFKRWILTGEGRLSGTTYTFGTGAGTLTAEWEIIQYTVIFDANGGTLLSSTNSITVDAGSSITLPTLQRDGFEFIGWHNSTGINSTLIGNADDEYIPTCNTILHAKWSTYIYNRGDECRNITGGWYASNSSTTMESDHICMKGSAGENISILPLTPLAKYEFNEATIEYEYSGTSSYVNKIMWGKRNAINGSIGGFAEIALDGSGTKTLSFPSDLDCPYFCLKYQGMGLDTLKIYSIKVSQ